MDKFNKISVLETPSGSAKNQVGKKEKVAGRVLDTGGYKTYLRKEGRLRAAGGTENEGSFCLTTPRRAELKKF